MGRGVSWAQGECTQGLISKGRRGSARPLQAEPHQTVAAVARGCHTVALLETCLAWLDSQQTRCPGWSWSGSGSSGYWKDGSPLLIQCRAQPRCAAWAAHSRQSTRLGSSAVPTQGSCVGAPGSLRAEGSAPDVRCPNTRLATHLPWTEPTSPSTPSPAFLLSAVASLLPFCCYKK